MVSIMSELLVKRKRESFTSNPKRVIAKFYEPAGRKRKQKIIKRVLNLSEQECKSIIDGIISDFADRHYNIEKIFLKNFKKVVGIDPKYKKLSHSRKLFIGSLFTHEYSIEAAALFNPSIIRHPDQRGLKDGETRFIISLRATGEGHISSIVFRSGIVDSRNRFFIDPVSPFVELPQLELNPFYFKEVFHLKAVEAGIDDELADLLFSRLSASFSYTELESSINEIRKIFPENGTLKHSIKIIEWLVRSNYEENFDKKSKLSERVIFPLAESEIQGMEDARFVEFREDDGEQTYYATYTAYDGKNIRPSMLTTRDFVKFKMCSLTGTEISNKGFALFPRKINGMYCMLGRQDGESLYYMESENLLHWDKKEKIYSPNQPWEFVQLGNCGSPIETEEGWVVLTHGVGAVRTYCIGALLLDLNNPKKVIGRLNEPLMKPNEFEREGYVPNVVYTCGAMIHNESLIIPYAASDYSASIAVVSIKCLLKLLKNSKIS